MPRKKKEVIEEEVLDEIEEEEIEEEYEDEDYEDEDYEEEEYEEDEEEDEEYDEEYEEEYEEDFNEAEFSEEDEINEEDLEEDLDSIDDNIDTIDDIDSDDTFDDINDIVGGLSGVGDTGELEGTGSGGADTMTTAEFYEKLERLAELGKERDVLNQSDIEEFFKDDNIDPEMIEKAIEYLEGKEIAVLRPEDSDADREIDESEHKEILDLAASENVSTEDPVRMYLKDIGQVQLLTADEERELAMTMEKGIKAHEELKELQARLREGSRGDNGEQLSDEERAELEEQIKEKRALVDAGNDAKQALTGANLRLVVSIAKRYVGRGMLFLDLIQEGNLGLVKAVEKFDYTKGYKFSTYATWWIRQAITRAIADQARTIRIPVHMVETINKLIRVSRQLLQELGREATSEEIAEQMDIPVEKVREILKISQEPVSLETPIGEEEDSHLGDFIQDDNVPVPVEAATQTLLREQLDEVLETLSDRERKVLILRFGLKDGRSRTLEEVGKEFNVTRERIRQIEAKALRKLRHPSRSRKLKDYLEQ